MATSEKVISYRVAWSEEDGEWVATASAFPSLSWLADTPRNALNGLLFLLDEMELTDGDF